MENVDNGIFLKSGIVVKEGGRFTYTFKGYGSNGVEGILEFRDVREEDEGVYTCLAYKAGITHTKTFTLKTGLYSLPLTLHRAGMISFLYFYLVYSFTHKNRAYKTEMKVKEISARLEYAIFRLANEYQVEQNKIVVNYSLISKYDREIGYRGNLMKLLL